MYYKIGDKMKKQIIVGVIILIIGFLIGNKIYIAKTSLTSTFSEGDTYYFLQIYYSRAFL